MDVVFDSKLSHLSRAMRAVTIDDKEDRGVGFTAGFSLWYEAFLEPLGAEIVVRPSIWRAGDTIQCWW